VIRSMTGFGRKETDDAAAHFLVEIRSLNNRYLDIQVKAPRGLAMLEPRVKKTVQDRFSRGRFDVFITRNGQQEKNAKLVVNEELAGQYVAALRDLKSQYGLQGEIALSTVAAFQDIVAVSETVDDPEKVWQVLSTGLSQALDELDRMRTEEGAALARDILSRIGTIDLLTDAIGKKSPASVEHARKRMTETLNKLLAEQPDPVRLAQEIAILAERTDVTEELTRLGSHMNQFRTLMTEAHGETVGRKLDFLIQEMGREVNTIASKAMDAEISMDVVNIKAELEKIREQVQNIE
jgi:uncharacterized protein (TIGR00255 family)